MASSESEARKKGKSIVKPIKILIYGETRKAFDTKQRLRNKATPKPNPSTSNRKIYRAKNSRRISFLRPEIPLLLLWNPFRPPDVSLYIALKAIKQCFQKTPSSSLLTRRFVMKRRKKCLPKFYCCHHDGTERSEKKFVLVLSVKSCSTFYRHFAKFFRFNRWHSIYILNAMLSADCNGVGYNAWARCSWRFNCRLREANNWIKSFNYFSRSILCGFGVVATNRVS